MEVPRPTYIYKSINTTHNLSQQRNQRHKEVISITVFQILEVKAINIYINSYGRLLRGRTAQNLRLLVSKLPRFCTPTAQMYGSVQYASRTV